MAPVALGLDSGTSGVRVMAVDEEGTLLAETTRSYPLLTPQPGWTEQRPSDWVEGALSALQEVMAGLEHQGHEVVALGLSGQMHGLVPLDKQGEPLRPAIL